MPTEAQLDEMAQLTFGQRFKGLSAANRVEIINLCIQMLQAKALTAMLAEVNLDRQKAQTAKAPKSAKKGTGQ